MSELSLVTDRIFSAQLDFYTLRGRPILSDTFSRLCFASILPPVNIGESQWLRRLIGRSHGFPPTVADMQNVDGVAFDSE